MIDKDQLPDHLEESSDESFRDRVYWKGRGERWWERLNWTSPNYNRYTTKRVLPTKLVTDSTTHSYTQFPGSDHYHKNTDKKSDHLERSENFSGTRTTASTPSTTSVVLTATLASLAIIVVVLIILIGYFGYTRRWRRDRRSSCTPAKTPGTLTGVPNFGYDRGAVHTKVDRLSIIPECAEEQEYDYVDPSTTTLTILPAAHLQTQEPHPIYQPMIISGLDHHVYAESPKHLVDASSNEQSEASAPPEYTELALDKSSTAPPVYADIDTNQTTSEPPEYAELESSAHEVTDRRVDNAIYQDIDI